MMFHFVFHLYDKLSAFSISTDYQVLNFFVYFNKWYLGM